MSSRVSPVGGANTRFLVRPAAGCAAVALSPAPAAFRPCPRPRPWPLPIYRPCRRLLGCSALREPPRRSCEVRPAPPHATHMPMNVQGKTVSPTHK